MSAQSIVNRNVEVAFGKAYGTLPVGYAGEHLASMVSVDCGAVAERYPGATYAILLSRANEEPYIPAPAVTPDANHRIAYTLTRTETAIPGTLRMEVQARDGKTVLKSSIFYFSIGKSLDTPAPPPAPAMPGWAEAVLEAEAVALDSAARAAAAEAGAVRSAAGAAQSERQALAYRDEAEAAAATAAELWPCFAVQTASGGVAAIQSGLDGVPLAVAVQTVATQSGSGTPDPSNARPIAGKSSVTVARSGKNHLTSDDWANNTNTTHTYAEGVFKITPTSAGTTRGIFLSGVSIVPQRYGYLAGQNVVFSFDGMGEAARVINARCGNGSLNVSLTTAWQRFSITIPAFQATEFHFYTTDASGVSPFYIRNIQLEPGSAATAYAPYKKDTYTIALSEAAYGLSGAADVVGNDGVSIKNTKLISFDGTEAWSISSAVGADGSRLFNYPANDGVVVSNSPMISSHFVQTTNPNTEMRHGQCKTNVLATNILGLYFAYSGMTTVTEWKAYLAAQKAAGTPVQVAYELASQQTLSIAKVKIPALPGQNNIWSDAGQVTVTQDAMRALSALFRGDGA